MVPVPLSRLQPSRIDAIEDWPWLNLDVLHSSRSRQVCMTCHFFRHHPGPNCIPLLTCHLHQGLIASGNSRDRILQAYQLLEPADIDEALTYAAWRMEEREEALVLS